MGTKKRRRRTRAPSGLALRMTGGRRSSSAYAVQLETQTKMDAGRTWKRVEIKEAARGWRISKGGRKEKKRKHHMQALTRQDAKACKPRELLPELRVQTYERLDPQLGLTSCSRRRLHFAVCFLSLALSLFLAYASFNCHTEEIVGRRANMDGALERPARRKRRSSVANTRSRRERRGRTGRETRENMARNGKRRERGWTRNKKGKEGPRQFVRREFSQHKDVCNFASSAARLETALRNRDRLSGQFVQGQVGSVVFIVVF